MRSNIFLGKTNLSLTKALLNKLKQNYDEEKTSHHIFLVPDRVTVLTEVKIFESLNIESTTSIEVLTMSRLSSKVLGSENVISKNASCMIIQKILLEEKPNLKCFNKTITTDLSNNVYEIISQFKSCKINFDEVCVGGKDKILEDKLSDISLIYRRYQEYLTKNNLLDSMDKIDKLIEKLDQSSLVKDSFVYVCNFDGFTFQGFQLIDKISKICKEFNIGVLDSTNPSNEHIYNKDFLEKVKKILSFSNPNIICCEDEEKGDFAHLRDNLYSFNLSPKKMERDAISLFEGEDFSKEVLFCASNIKNLIITKKYSFNDFVVVVPNLQEKFVYIQKVFNDYGFNYFLDIKEDFEKSVLVKFVKSLFEMINENYSKTSVLSFVKNPLFNANAEVVEDFEDVLNKFNVKNYFDLKNFDLEIENKENFDLVRNALLKKTERFKDFVKLKNKTFYNFVEELEMFLKSCNVEELLQNEISRLADLNEIKLVKLYEQYYGKITEIFEEIKTVLKNEVCNFDLFVSTFIAGIKSISLSTIPISTNAIFVGDSNSSFFDKAKVYFILNIQEEVFPKVLSDYSLISDKEISKLSEKYLLEPSIKEVNFKQRFKAFDTLLKPEDKLFLSCNYSSQKFLKGKIIEDVSKLFLVDDDNGGFKPLQFVKKEDLNEFVLNNNYKTAYNEFATSFRSYIDGQGKNVKKLAILFNALKLKKEDLSKFYYKNEINLKNNPFFLNNKVSVSQIENYMACPFMHFCNYGLNLKERERGKINQIDIGLILHSIAEILLRENKFPIEENLVEEASVKAFEKALSKEIYEGIKRGKENKILIKNLKKEAVRLCGYLNYQIKNSKFKPTYFEFGFGREKGKQDKSFDFNNGKTKLVGQIDRVDVFDKYFRIIDYKTGNCDRNLKELYFGKKVQLDAYLHVFESLLKLTPAGAYYFPIKGGFEKEEDKNSKYKLKGETLNNFDVILASDVRFLNEENKDSDLIDIKYLKSDKGGRKLSSRAKVLSAKEIDERGEYAIKLIEKTCEDINKLNLTPKPLVLDGKDTCEYCKYFGFCKFSENFGNVKRNPKTKIDKSYLEFLEEEK